MNVIEDGADLVLVLCCPKALNKLLELAAALVNELIIHQNHD